MEKKPNVATRRGLLFGVLAGAGAATVAVATAGKAKAAKAETAGGEPGKEVLYRRTAEAERYYKTLYY